MKGKLIAGLAVVALVGSGLAGYVSATPINKTTVKNPASAQTSFFYSPIGAGAKISGPGAFGSTTAAGLKLFSFQNGALNGTSGGSTSLIYTADTPGPYYKVYVSVVGGFNFTYAKRWGGGAGSVTNTINWNVVENVDGVAVVALNGSETSTSTVNAATGTDLKWKPVLKFTGGLLVITNGASVTSTVGSNTSVTLSNSTSTGIGTGNIIGLTFGS
jgi:hypothetical protein